MENGGKLRVNRGKTVDAHNRPKAGTVQRMVAVAKGKLDGYRYPVADAHLDGIQVAKANNSLVLLGTRNVAVQRWG